MPKLPPKTENTDRQCEYIVPKNGQRCPKPRMHGQMRCWVHPVDRFPSLLKPPDPANADRKIKTLENVVETTEWIFNQVYLGLIPNEKGRILTDILKAQVTFLNEIYKRSPEGQEKTLDQIGRVVDMARRMTMEDASRMLLSKNFGAMLDQAVLIDETEVVILEEKKNAETEINPLLEGDILRQTGEPGPGVDTSGSAGDAG